MKLTRFQFNPFLSRTAALPAIALLMLTVSSASAQTWAGTLNGTTESWNVNGNWSPATFPNAIGASANLNVDFSANKLVSLQQAITVGTLTMGDSSGTSTLGINSGTGTNALTFDASSGNATLTTSGGINTISTNLVLTDSVNITNNSALTLSGTITGAGALIKEATASGLTLSGNSTAWAGGITLKQSTLTAGGSASAVFGTGAITFQNASAGSGNTIAFNGANSRTIANNIINDNAAAVSGTQFAQIQFQGGTTGFRVQTFSGSFSTGTNYFTGPTNPQALNLDALGTTVVADEGTLVFSGDWTNYLGVTANTAAIRIADGGSYLIDSATSMAGSGGYQFNANSANVAAKLILNGAYTMNNAVNFAGGSGGLRNSMGSRNAASTTATMAGAVTLSDADGTNLFSQTANAAFAVTGLISGSNPLEINRSYSFTSANGTNNASETPTGTVDFSRPAGNTYTGGTTVTAGTLLVNNTSNSGTGTSGVTVASGATLGGTGTIAPTSTTAINGINVSGVLAPGSGGIGNLTIDLTSVTSGTVGLNTGSSFAFDLGTANPTIGSIGLNTSDLLTLAGAGAGDFAFTGNNVNFLSTGAVGFYKLFDTSSDNSNTWTGLTFDGTTGIVSAGLTYSNLAGVLTGNFLVGTAGNGGTTGDIYFQVIPEPSAASLLGGLGVLALLRRRRSGY